MFRIYETCRPVTPGGLLLPHLSRGATECFCTDRQVIVDGDAERVLVEADVVMEGRRKVHVPVFLSHSSALLVP